MACDYDQVYREVKFLQGYCFHTLGFPCTSWGSTNQKNDFSSLKSYVAPRISLIKVQKNHSFGQLKMF